MQRLSLGACAIFALSLLTTCASLPKAGGSGGGSGNINPATCGNLAVTDAGRKYVAFLRATAQLAEASRSLETTVRDACGNMGKELAMTASELSADTRTVCKAVFARLDEYLQVGVKARSELRVDYKPAVCTVNIDAAAKATAECEARAQAEVAVRCAGTCGGTCSGRCDGTCVGGGTSASCQGTCKGTCQGTCSGTCQGRADVDASAQCRAEAEVRASVDATCEPAQVDVAIGSEFVVDTTKADAAMRAIRAGMPVMGMAKARLESLGAATKSWMSAAAGLSSSGRELAASFAEQSMCITGQVAEVMRQMTQIEASISVSVEVSASAEGSFGTR